MKKIIAILLAACLCLGLCACGNVGETKDKQANYNQSETNYNPSEYVGVWVSTTSDSNLGPYSFQLFENGKSIIQMSFAGGDIDEIPWAMAGEWMVSDNKIILLYEEDTATCSYDSAYIFEIESTDKININGDMGVNEREYIRK